MLEYESKEDTREAVKLQREQAFSIAYATLAACAGVLFVVIYIYAVVSSRD